MIFLISKFLLTHGPLNSLFFMRASNRVVLASSNLHKFLEFRQLLLDFPEIELVPAHELLRNADKIGKVEQGLTYEENSAAKARLTNQGTHYPSLADDSGLEIASLEGRPGVRSARYALPRAGETQDQANIKKLMQELHNKRGDDRNAQFVCVLSLAMEGVLIHAKGVLKGRILDAPRGQGGFGYDPIFVPEGDTRTLAELDAAEKNRISHRARALQELLRQLQVRGMNLAKP